MNENDFQKIDGMIARHRCRFDRTDATGLLRAARPGDTGLRKMSEQREPLIITQNGEAKVVLQDIESYEQSQETMALLKILALGNRLIEAGKLEPAAGVIQRLRQHRSDR